MNISWKLFWATLAAVLALAIAGLSALLGLSLLLVIPVCAIAVAAAVAAARVVVHRGEMFQDIALTARVQIVRWIGAAGGSYAVWVVAFVLKPVLWVVWLLVLAAIGALVYGVAHMHEYLLTKVVRPSPAQIEAAQQQRRDLELPEQNFEGALKLLGYNRLLILGWEPIGGDPARGEKPFGVRFRVKTPASMDLQFGPGLAVRLANALGEVMGVDLKKDWVAIQDDDVAGVYTVTVVTQEVMARIYPYTDPAEQYVPGEQVLMGYQLDGRSYDMDPDQHGQVVGGSTWGKSSLINDLIAFHTRRGPRGQVWVCGVEKLYDLVAGWVEPYRGHDLPVPIDWIANGQEDVLKMLVAGMSIARWRQKQPISKRGGWPHITIILDEASFALENRRVTHLYQGLERNASDMVAAIAKGAASGDVHIVLASQRDTNDQWGDKGGDVSASMGWAAGFRTRDPNGIGRLMNDYKIPVPRHKGEYLLDPGNGDLPIRLKAPYLQSIDPTKPRLHNGVTVADVAWSRRTIERGIDPGSAAAADEATGGAYSRRLTRMNDDMERYLTQAVAVEPGESGAQREGYELARLELAALGIGTGSSGGPSAAVEPAAGGVATLVGRKPLKERVVDIVQGIGGQVSREQIVNALADSGEKPGDQVLTNALSKAVKDGLLARPDGKTGVYTATAQ